MLTIRTSLIINHRNRTEVIRWFIKQNADLNRPYPPSLYPRDNVSTKRFDLLDQAARESSYKTFRMLVRRGANIHSSNALHHAVWRSGQAGYGNYKSVWKDISMLLIHKGYPVDAWAIIWEPEDDKYELEDHQTPLQWAVQWGSVEAVDLLLHHKADPNKRSSSGRTAIWYAEQSNREDMLVLLRSLRSAGSGVADD